MIIDVPECWREAIEESGAKLSYKTADNVAKELKDKIEDFSIQYKELCDPVWDRDYKAVYQKDNDYVKSMRKYFSEPSTETK